MPMKWWPRKQRMRVGVYVDAFNLYYGARDHCGRNEPGWRWLDLVALVESKMNQRINWKNSHIEKIVYCTAERNKDNDPTSRQDQFTYIQALMQDSRVSVAMGQYKGKVVSGPVGRSRGSASTFKPYKQLDVSETFPFHHKIRKDVEGIDRLWVEVKTFEEKATDVNVAAHLLIDVLEKHIDAAIVITNDGDLQFALKHARKHVPIGLINPGTKFTVHELLEPFEEGSKNWWANLTDKDYKNHQLPDQIGDICKPNGW